MTVDNPLQIQLDAYREKNEKLHEALAEKMSALLATQQSLIDLWEEKRRIESDYQTASTQAELLKSNFVALTNDKIILTKKYSTLSEQCERLQKEHQALKKTSGGLDQQVLKLRKERDVLSAEKNRLLLEKDKLRFLFRDIGTAFWRHRFYIPYCYRSIRRLLGIPVQKKGKNPPKPSIKKMQTVPSPKT